MTNDTLAKLAACPFCGGAAFEEEDGHIECESCGASMFCAASWNERAPLTAQAPAAAEPTDAQIDAAIEAYDKAWVRVDMGRHNKETAMRAALKAAQQAAQAPEGWVLSAREDDGAITLKGPGIGQFRFYANEDPASKLALVHRFLAAMLAARPQAEGA